VTRETVAGEGVAGGFAGLYPVFKAMEEAGRVRRGYFVAGQGAAQFAVAGAEGRLREPAARDAAAEPTAHVLAATDPANPYGAALRWPGGESQGARPQRAAGSRVVLVNGRLLGYLSPTGRQLLTFFEDAAFQDGAASVEQRRGQLAQALAAAAQPGRPILLATVDGQPATRSPLAESLRDAGFRETSQGLLHRGREEQTDPPPQAPPQMTTNEAAR